MPTLHLILDEGERPFNVPKMKGVHYAKLHLENFKFSDQEITDYAAAAGMMLLSAVQGSELPTPLDVAKREEG